MTNDQIAHDLAVAYMAGRQLPAEILVDEYRKNYELLLECLNADTPVKE